MTEVQNERPALEGRRRGSRMMLFTLAVHKVQDTGLHTVETTDSFGRTLASSFTTTGDAEPDITAYHARHIRVLAALAPQIDDMNP
jgi:hypothetical protein